LNRPRLKEKLRPLQAKVRTGGIMCCDAKKQESGICVVGIGRDLTSNLRLRFRRMLRLPSLVLSNPFQYIALCRAVAFQGLLKSLLLKRFL
jgi:hypothetical protein